MFSTRRSSRHDALRIAWFSLYEEVDVLRRPRMAMYGHRVAANHDEPGLSVEQRGDQIEEVLVHRRPQEVRTAPG